MQFTLGTAQFGQVYGIANNHGRIDHKTAAAIVRRSQEMGWDTLDTAIAYGESESILGRIGVKQWKVISKLPVIPESCLDINQLLMKLTLESLSRLKIKKLHGLILHKSNQLTNSIGPDLYQGLLALKTEGLVEKIGISIYRPEELDVLCSNYLFDIVQAPFNILDSKILTSGWADSLQNMGTDLYVRSVFLQGLLLMSPDKRPIKFNRWKQVWEEWDNWLNVNNLTAVEACIGFIQCSKGIDRVVVGVDSVIQLEEVNASIKQEAKFYPKFNLFDDELLINPSKWSKL